MLGFPLPSTGGFDFLSLNLPSTCWVGWRDHHREVNHSWLPRPVIRDGPCRTAPGNMKPSLKTACSPWACQVRSCKHKALHCFLEPQILYLLVCHLEHVVFSVLESFSIFPYHVLWGPEYPILLTLQRMPLTCNESRDQRYAFWCCRCLALIGPGDLAFLVGAVSPLDRRRLWGSPFLPLCRQQLTKLTWLWFFERPAYKSSPWLASGNFDFQSVPTTPRIDLLCLNCLDKHCGWWWTPVLFFFSGSLAFCYVSDRQCLPDQPQIKTG